jgi:hypothetical protein
MRLAQTQVWPAFLYFEAIAPLTAASISASSKTMNGALPPNSSESFLTVPAHCSISNLPTSVEPVKVNLRTVAFEVGSPPISLARPMTRVGIRAYADHSQTKILETSKEQLAFSNVSRSLPFVLSLAPHRNPRRIRER